MIAQIRLIADTQSELEQAVDEIKAKHRTSGFQLPERPGRRGGWLTYGLLIIDEPSQTTNVVLVDPTTGEIIEKSPEHRRGH
jgi:hypothetical protein